MSAWLLLSLLSATAEHRLPLDIHGVHHVAENDFWIGGKRGMLCKISLPLGEFDPGKHCVFLGDALITSIALRGPFGVAAGEAGSLHVTHDAGNTWKAVETGLKYHLLDVEILDDSTAIAVGDWGSVARTEDGGATWTEIPLEVEVSEEFFGVPTITRSLTHPETGKLYPPGSELPPDVLTALAEAAMAVYVRNDIILNDIIVDGNDLYLAAERGKLFLSSDRGLHFREISLRPDSTDDPFAGEEDQATWFFGAVESQGENTTTEGLYPKPSTEARRASDNLAEGTTTLLLGGSLATLKKITLGEGGKLLAQEVVAAPWENQPAVFSGAMTGQTVCLAGAEGTIGTSFDGGKTFAKIIDRAYEARWFRRALAPSDGRCIFFGEQGLIVEVTE